VDWNDSDLETTILSITTPLIPSWVVYASEEEGEPGDDPADLIWTEPVILWALVEVQLSAEEADSNRFLGEEVPAPRRKVVGMIGDENGPTLAGEAGFIFVGYSTKEEIDRAEWGSRARSVRRKWARMCGASSPELRG